MSCVVHLKLHLPHFKTWGGPGDFFILTRTLLQISKSSGLQKKLSTLSVRNLLSMTSTIFRLGRAFLFSLKTFCHVKSWAKSSNYRAPLARDDVCDGSLSCCHGSFLTDQKFRCEQKHNT